MNIEPTENDLREINAMLGFMPERFDENREQCRKIWDNAAQRVLRDHLYRQISRDIHQLMAPPPSLTNKSMDW